MDGKEPLGVARQLPDLAADILVKAALEARAMPQDSFARMRVIRDAIVTVRAYYPQLFRNESARAKPDRSSK